MPGSTNKLKISPDDLAQGAPRLCQRESPSDLPRIVVRDLAPLRSWPRWLLMSVALVVTAFVTLVPLWFSKQSPSANWAEQVAALADRSIVQIQAADRLGTGFVIASREQRHLILTNRHVLAALGVDRSASGPIASQCSVILRNGETVVGSLVGLPRAPELDLALLEVSARGLRPLGPIAPFSGIRPGQRVVAVGHPHGLDFTITDGIVSAKRNGLFIQTSAAINPGNSGGPLIDQCLRVIGVNTLTISPDAAHGLGFAIRADAALDISAWEVSDTILDLMRSIKR